LKQLNLRVLALMLVMLTILVSAFIFAGKAILGLWLHDMSVVEIVYPVLALLVIGTGMNGIYNVGYMNWLAEGSVKKILRVNVLSLLLAIIFTPIFITNYGMQGAACGWLVINGVGMLFSLDWLKAEKTNHA
jgi:O-antigen/teichoic acid export membrane protein